MFIDLHTHPVAVKEFVKDNQELTEAVRRVFGLFIEPQPLKTFLLQMDVSGVERAVLLPIDCSTAHGCKIFTNEQIAELVEENPRFIGFASVDPHNPEAPDELAHAVKNLGLLGLKLDASLQRFQLDDKQKVYPVYAKCCELNIPVLLHMGHSWAPLGLAYYSTPVRFEQVLQDFPNLKVIIAHFGWPWVMESIMLALKYPNVYLDTSLNITGTSTEMLRRVLGNQVGLENFERRLRYQTVFGSNYPREDIKRVVKGLRDLGLSSQTEACIFGKNALKILSLEEGKQ